LKKNKIIIAICFCLFSGIFAQQYTPHWYQQNDWFLEFGENTAQYVNPASIAENDQIEAALGIFTTISGKAGQEFFAIVHPFDYNHSAGFTIFENGASLEGDAAPFVENAYQLAYAYRFGPKLPMSHQLAVGVNVTVIQFDLFNLEDLSFFSYGLDVGLSYNPVSNSKFGHLQFGLAAQNVIQPQVKRTDATETYPIPRNINPSVFWRGWRTDGYSRIEAAASVSLVDITSDHYDEMRFFPSARITYFIGPMLGLKVKWSKQEYLVFGGTVNVKRINLFRYFCTAVYPALVPAE
jgi:hypothetical protein